jgi:hypothetical protein
MSRRSRNFKFEISDFKFSFAPVKIRHISANRKTFAGAKAGKVFSFNEIGSEMSGGFFDAARFDAVCANRHFSDLAVFEGLHLLKVGVKPTFGHIMRMADIVAHHWFFPANFTCF